MKRTQLAALFLVVALCASVLSGCAATGPLSSPGEGSSSANDSEYRETVPSMPTTTPTPSPLPPRPSGKDDEMAPSEPDNQADRMVVRSGFMEIVVTDVTAATQSVAGMAGTFGGYVVSSSVYQDSGHMFGSVVIRVDANRFDSALNALRALATEVARETTSATDVTEEYVDLSARKRNLERTEQQLLGLMEEAGTVEELLNVQRELSNVRGQIEQLEARMRYLEQTSAMSVIEVFLRESVLAVSFSADARTVKVDEPVAFKPEISGGFLPYSYWWDFGDGATGNQESPTHTYGSQGVYSVTLKVSDDRGTTESYTRSYYIEVEGVWSPGEVFRNAVNGLGSLGRWLLSFAIWFIVYAPVWLVLGGIAYLIYRRAMRKQHTRLEK